MSRYDAKVSREGRYWLVEIRDVGLTQARSLSEAQAMAADLISSMLDIEVLPDQVQLDIELPGGLVTKVRAAKKKTAAAEEAQRQAAELLRETARRLRHDAELTGRDAAFVLGVSEQRVSQLAGKSHASPLATRQRAS